MQKHVAKNNKFIPRYREFVFMTPLLELNSFVSIKQSDNTCGLSLSLTVIPFNSKLMMEVKD